MSHEIEDELRDLSQDAPEFTPRPLKNPQNRGLVRSAFQKAMRRGELDRSLRMSELLMDGDESYTWKSLATILIEDIGFGDMDLMSYGSITTLKAVREAHGGNAGSHRLFAAMVKRACEAPKSRSCCELSLGADLSEAEMFAEYKDVDEPDLIATMAHGNPIPAYVAACTLRKNLRGEGGDVLMPVLQRMMEILGDPSEARACMMNFERTVDNMNLALFPITQMLNFTGEIIDEYDEVPDYPEEIIIKSVSSSALDMHTGVGSRALSALVNNMKSDHEWVQAIADTAEKPQRAMGSLVFIVEGGLVDRRLVCPSLNKMKVYQDTNFAKGTGVPAEYVDNPDFFAQIKGHVHDNIPLLNELRQWSAKK